MPYFLTLLPVYLLANLHCVGMCGPIVALLAKHRGRWGYFLGRCLSFSLVGTLAGGMGSVLSHILTAYHLPATTSLLFGIFILLFSLSEWKPHLFSKLNSKTTKIFSSLLSRSFSLSPFLVGVFTVFLPCGQSLFVFSLSALTEDPLMGFFNALLFTFLTTPGLAISFFLPQGLIKSGKKKKVALLLMSLVGLQSFLRGAADLGWVPHCTLLSLSTCHITLF